MDREEITTKEKPLGAAPSIVKSFAIEGLYGYRNISLSSSYAATILIAKNGSGKTTLLGALDAVLKRQFLRLNNLDFHRIIFSLEGHDECLVIRKDDIERACRIKEDSDIAIVARRIGVDPSAIADLVTSNYSALLRDYGGDDLLEKFVGMYSYSHHQAIRACSRLEASLYTDIPELYRIKEIISGILKDTEIVYLPTYRRIELPLESDVDEARRTRRKRSIQSRLGLGRGSLYSTDIQFGLSDISERLSSLNQDILLESNQGYRQISANIINELIRGDLDKEQPGPLEKPDPEALSLFFSRIKDNNKMGRYASDLSIPDMGQIYTDNDLSDVSNKFLSYFLNKLNSVIQATRGIETTVEEFISSCNKYLSVPDVSAVPGGSVAKHAARDDKALILDRRTLQVKVKSLATGKTMSLEFLSSGEKQMISLFARLYLYPNKKLVLIDEPELSLSLDWQRKILLDVLRSHSCEQVIAITHSPFVFDNELEPYAKSLDFSINMEVDLLGDAITEELEEDQDHE
nr:AAA family ATPase [uncultured Pseudomonas sp.]